MAWIWLVAAGLLEVVWAVALKYSNGLTRFWPAVATFACMGASYFLLALAMKRLPLGTAYVVWTGNGAVGTAILGMALFGEPASPGRIACIGLIVAGIVGLKVC